MPTKRKNLTGLAEDLKLDTMKALRMMELMMPIMSFCAECEFTGFAIWYRCT